MKTIMIELPKRDIETNVREKKIIKMIDELGERRGGFANQLKNILDSIFAVASLNTLIFGDFFKICSKYRSLVDIMEKGKTCIPKSDLFKLFFKKVENIPDLLNTFQANLHVFISEFFETTVPDFKRQQGCYSKMKNSKMLKPLFCESDGEALDKCFANLNISYYEQTDELLNLIEKIKPTGSQSKKLKSYLIDQTKKYIIHVLEMRKNDGLFVGRSKDFFKTNKEIIHKINYKIDYLNNLYFNISRYLEELAETYAQVDSISEMLDDAYIFHIKNSCIEITIDENITNKF